MGNLKNESFSSNSTAWFAVFFVLLGLKVAHLTIFQHEYWSRAAEKSQAIKRFIPAPRGEIFDREGIALAQNTQVFEACICYGELLNLSRQNRQYAVKKLSQSISNILGVDSEELEDEIYAKAAQNPHTPFIIQSDLTENAFYRLKAIEKFYPGLIVRETYRRTYPQGKLMASVLGYLGAINQTAYEASLKKLFDLEALARLYDEGLTPNLPLGIETIGDLKEEIHFLKSKAYFFSDLLGQAGLEKAYDQQLRGTRGRESYDIDSRGFLKYKHSESTHPIPGESLYLTISAKLQEHVEKLLIESETQRRGKSTYYSSLHKNKLPLKEPWIKGGAIVAIEPSTGEVLAFGTTPRFDPNDFNFSVSPARLFGSSNEHKIHKWLENSTFIEAVWDQKIPLEKELLVNGKVETETTLLTWELFLNKILPSHSSVKHALNKTPKLKDALSVLNQVEEAALNADLSISELCEGECFLKVDNQKLTDLKTPYSRKLYIDILRLAIDNKALNQISNKDLLNRTLDQHFQDTKNYLCLLDFTKEVIHKAFHLRVFSKWKETYGKAYLKQMRQIEKEEGKYARPYTVYLKKKENELFESFWKTHKETLISYFLHSNPDFNEELSSYYQEIDTWKKELYEGAHKALFWTSAYRRLSDFIDSLDYCEACQYLKTLRSYEALTDRLIGAYPLVKGNELKHLAAAFYPRYGYGYMTHKAYQLSSAPGSIFKLVPAYASLVQRELEGHSELNPLTLIDTHERKPGGKGFISVAKTIFGKPYPRIYKEGRLIQSARRNIGKIDLAGALAQTSNPYFSILCKDYLKEPGDLIEAAKKLGLGHPTGIDLPFESEGSLPTDLATNPSGLYAAAIGQHTVQTTPIQIAMMLCKLGTKIRVQPFIASHFVGLKSASNKRSNYNLSCNSNKLLSKLGIDFPLFVQEDELEVCTTFKNVKASPFPISDSVQRALFKGMKSVTQDPIGTAYPTNIHSYPKNHGAICAYRNLYTQIIGKTSTAEIIDTVCLDEDQRSRVYKNTWFGGIAYPDDSCSGQPELVVVVYLPYGAGGKDPAPIVASVIEKWREVKKQALAQSK